MEKFDIAVVVSKHDVAGMNIARQLQLMQRFPAAIAGKKVGLFPVGTEIIRCENIDREIAADTFIFASKHVSRAGINSLTVHSIGNWAKAEAGGRDRTLVKAPAALMKKCLQLMSEKAENEELDYEVIQEATHHGPNLDKPAMFIEIGSSMERWADEKAGRTVAETIVEAIKESSVGKIKTAVGAGGMHYAQNFRKIMLNTETAVSHICPKHQLAVLDEAMLRQAMEQSEPKAELVILDWKGLGTEKERIKKMLELSGIKWEKASFQKD